MIPVISRLATVCSAQAKIMEKSVILFWLINMTIWCKHVRRLELPKFLISVLRIYQLG